jgi:tRNA (guanine26-N2/guanine27-N2)-dimethyltransferase
LRYVLEIPEVESVVANDLDPTALAALKENVKRNGLTEEVVIPSLGDAVAVMHRSKPPDCPRFEAVEIDPYGTAAPFLDSAVQCVAEGGLLMVTCTDLAVLCASYPEKCYANYGAWPHKAKSCHEAALRIVLACIESHANRHKRYIEPLLCVHINFYVRLFVRVYTGPGEVKKAPTKLSSVYQCTGCDTFALQPLARLVEKNGNFKVLPGQGPPVGRECEHCGRVHHVGGPLWSAPIHDHAFVTALLTSLKTGEGAEMASAKRLIGMLTSVLEEIPDAPLFYQLSHQCGVLHVPVPQMVGVMSALMRQGYRVSRSHTDAGAIKTDAPAKALWDVLRCWANSQGQGVGQDRSKELSPTSPAYAILSQAPAIVADFRPLKEAVQLLSKRDEDGVKLGRWMPNPEEWGPGSKATSHASFDAGAGGDEGGGGGGGGGGGAPVALGGAAPAMLAKRARLQGKRGGSKDRKRQARDHDGAEAEGGGEEGGGEEGGGEGSGSPKN